MTLKLNGKSISGRAGGSIRAACGPVVGVGWSGGRGFEGDLVAEGLELADEVAGPAGGVEMTLVPVGAEFLV
ncbi:hypothetical protein [Streptomyces sp. JNUCC 63]